MSSRHTVKLVLAVIVAISAVAAAVFVWRTQKALPVPGSPVYEQASRAFYKGLASLEVGLLDDAKREFTTVTTTIPEEPAAWANLGLAHLRLGELEAAAEPIGRALMLAPENVDLVLLAGRMEITRGRLDEGLMRMRRAVELSSNALEPRFALADELERASGPDADGQALALLDELVELAPQNLAALAERARVAAKANDRRRLDDSISRLEPMAGKWPPPAMEQYQDLQRAVAANDFANAQRATAFLRNILRSVPAFREDLAAIMTPAELIAEPLDRFIVLAVPSATPADPDLKLTFKQEPIGNPLGLPVETMFTVAAGQDGAAAPVFVAQRGRIVSLTGQRVETKPATRSTEEAGNPRISVVADWNNDFRHDIITTALGGVRLLIQQDDGSFVEQTPPNARAIKCGCVGVWAADVEMDGDLDVVVSGSTASEEPFVLRNNGDGSWAGVTMFRGLTGVTDFAWADLDGDGDPDAAFLTREGLRVFANRQAGDFAMLAAPPATSPVAMTVGDLDADGRFELVVLERAGTIGAVTLEDGRWAAREIAKREPVQLSARLIAEDFDNNGAVDLILTSGAESRVWLGDSSRQLRLADWSIAGEVFPAGDLNADGRLDLLGVVGAPPPTGPQAVRLLGQGTTNYHWKQIRPRAQETAGDQRINSFGAGGYIEARAGLLFQKLLMTGGPVHIGLGTHSSIDVVRIVWPNGIPQAEFGTSVDDTVVIEQRLKGSCPWLFTWDGTRMVFVTDFLWRSPLGLRINAQDTAGVTQTEDWVRLRGDQLVPRDGRYDIRITAELWETHFFDHVSLMAVDHPVSTDVFVDERFSPASPPALAVQTVQWLRPVKYAWDEHGADVTRTVSAGDGNYLSTFTRGRYQGIAEDHFVEIHTGSIGRDAVLVATGWIYPTDSSINVAIAQAGITPHGLSLEALNRDGSWRVVNADLGFPAGKNKTIVIDLKDAAGADRVRLRTNLEIYWDLLQLGSRTDAAIRTTRIPAMHADLRYRGFSQTVSPRGDAPETPRYDGVASTSPRWRDLTGYHTRFGDVLELIERVDDRYVIMNAGDEMRLQFSALPPLESGWRRDFVLIGDGWEKDGDYNTAFSQTVLPLPSHDRANYGAGITSLALEDDPVYQRHRDDWQRYHTRYVTPRRFLDGLKPSNRN